MQKLVLTGGTGRLGSCLRAPRSRLCDELVSTDLAEGVSKTCPGARHVKADRQDPDAWSIHAVGMRIFCCAQVSSPRAVGTWLSHDDLILLVERSIDTPVTGPSVVCGVSADDRVPVDNAKAGHPGYRPWDNAEPFAKAVYAEAGPLDPADPGNMHHGGPFAAPLWARAAWSI